MSTSLNIEHVRAAQKRLGDAIRRTPVLRNESLDVRAGAELWLKAENLQHIGAFKARGALHAIGHLPEAERHRGVITFSSGNHAQAVAWAAKRFGMRATIVMPTDAPRIKVTSVETLGGEIIFAGTTSEERQRVAEELALSSGAHVVHPFDDPHIIAGAGTATLELVDEVARETGGSLDAMVVPVGGGGLIAGACLVCEAFGIPVYSAEPYGCDALAESLAAGRRVDVQPGPTLADGLKPVRVGALNFEIARRAVRGAYRVDDDELGAALTALLVHAKVLVEPSGAAGLAVALRRVLPGSPRRIGVLLSGGNVEPTTISRLVALG